MIESKTPLFYFDLLSRMAESIADELGLSLVAASKDEENLRAAFYVQFAGLPTTKADPKPDLVIEIATNLVSPAATELGNVRECWRFDGEQLKFYELQKGEYVEPGASLAFPFLQAEDLAAFLEQSKADSADTVLWRLRMLLQKHKPASD
ncbi:MAG: hypothetical protein HOP19_29535 [Acidobacteria bacterium]|nr:hypothetical protein [Acidobacteriota bacterium]